ncbi:MAG TPA: hypothetical protein ENJ42_00705 [Hellea balneolensis]|uniref:Gene transfer agent family protein n=1 Tax=Hellea balneolensis TaxID=287478 RepID=A0A7C5LZT4_9PROT|nr:hypothetical protein [Hellea balneolensis]
MTEFRRGDACFKYQGQSYTLRLSLGALAEIDARLGINGPVELANVFRSLKSDKNSAHIARTLLECLYVPAPPLETAGTPARAYVTNFGDIPLSVFMPAILRVFETAFAGEHP